MMKKFILFGLFSLLFVNISEAMIFTSPTIRQAQNFDGPWIECTPGGPAGCVHFSPQAEDGIAREFEIYDNVVVTSVSGLFVKFTDIPFDDPIVNPPGRGYIRLFSGEFDGTFAGRGIVPGSKIFETEVAFPNTFVQNINNIPNEPNPFDPTHQKVVNDLNILLSPGKYWISAQTKYFGRIIVLSPGDIDGYVVPEPASMLLFGTGLIGVFFRRRLV